MDKNIKQAIDVEVEHAEESNVKVHLSEIGWRY